jgi:hypothetical protein
MTQQRPARTNDGVLGEIGIGGGLCEALPIIAQVAIEAPGLALVLGIFLVPLAALIWIWAWKKDFPDKPRPEEAKSMGIERVMAVPPSETPSYLWDREIDGP